MDMRILPLSVKIMLESNPLRSRILVRRLAVQHAAAFRSRLVLRFGCRAGYSLQGGAVGGGCSGLG